MYQNNCWHVPLLTSHQTFSSTGAWCFLVHQLLNYSIALLSLLSFTIFFSYMGWFQMRYILNPYPVNVMGHLVTQDTLSSLLHKKKEKKIEIKKKDRYKLQKSFGNTWNNLDVQAAFKIVLFSIHLHLYYIKVLELSRIFIFFPHDNWSISQKFIKRA